MEKQQLIKELEERIDYLSHISKTGEKLQRLMNNQDFIDVFTDYIFKEKVLESVSNLSKENTAEGKERINSSLESISYIKHLLEEIIFESQGAEIAAQEDRQTINDLLNE